ncbi:transposable element Tc1 transposase [Trichonephila clavipes]|nr:transposable element Tc1 transposase [Trichonephila clavipes]
MANVFWVSVRSNISKRWNTTENDVSKNQSSDDSALRLPNTRGDWLLRHHPTPHGSPGLDPRVMSRDRAGLGSDSSQDVGFRFIDAHTKQFKDMDNKKKEISTSERKINVKRWKSHRDIARSVGRQYSSIQHVIYNFKSTRVYTSKPLLSRPSKLIIREKRNTARKILKKAGYHSRVVRRKPYISMTSWLKRIAFEKDHIHKPHEFWRTVIFSDEDKFCIFGIKGCKLVWRKPCTALQKQHLVPTVVTPKYLGNPPVDRDRLNAHPGFRRWVQCRKQILRKVNKDFRKRRKKKVRCRIASTTPLGGPQNL